MSRYYSVLVITVVVINGLHCTLICLVFLIPFFKIIILYNNCTYSVIVGLCILVFCSVLLRGVLFSFLFVLLILSLCFHSFFLFLLLFMLLSWCLGFVIIITLLSLHPMKKWGAHGVARYKQIRYNYHCYPHITNSTKKEESNLIQLTSLCMHTTTSVYTFSNTHTFPKHAHWNSDSVIFHSFCKHTLGYCCFLFWSSVVVVLSLLCFCLGEVSWLHIFC